MSRYLALLTLGLLGLVAGCSREPAPSPVDLLLHVPADTPYAFVTSKSLPDGLRDRLGDHYAAQMARQGAALRRVREQMEASDDAAPMARRADRLFDVLDALLAEFAGRDTAAAMRELGVEPVTRSVIYGIGLLPAMRVEIADAGRLEAMLDRVEQRAGVAASRGQLNTQAYRRIDLGEVDAVLAVTERHLVAGLLPDVVFERDLGLLLGQEQPPQNLADSGVIEGLIARHGFTGYGEGFIRLDELLAMMVGRAQGRNAEAMPLLGAGPPVVSEACAGLAGELVAGMPRMVVGITAADRQRLAARGIWESSPAVGAYLQKLAAPVPGVGGPYEGLLAVGMGIDLPQLRNAIHALLRTVTEAGAECEWVDRQGLEAVMPQLNLALGPMTAGIKGFNLHIDDLAVDPETLAPTDVDAGLLAAVDDPRGIFALGAMFNPALAALQVPDDGSFVELPRDMHPEAPASPVRVAIRDKSLLLVLGADPERVAAPLLSSPAATPAPLLAADYGVYQLVERFGEVVERASLQLRSQGEEDMALELGDQLAAFREQAKIFERLRVSLYAGPEGLTVEQVMELR